MKCLLLHNRHLSGPKISSWFIFYNIYQELKHKKYLLNHFSSDYDLTNENNESINDNIWQEMDCLYTVFAHAEAPLKIAKLREIPSFLEINYACSEIAYDFIKKEVVRMKFGLDELKYEHPLLGKKIYNLPTYIVGVGNKYTENTYKQFGIKNIKTFDAGIDYNHFKPLFKKRGKKKIRFTFTAASLHFRKGIQYIAQAWHNLSKKYHKDIELHMFGAKPYAEQTIHIFEKLIQYNNVYWHGFKSNQDKTYIYEHAISDCMISPTLAEGQSGTVLEGLSFGLYPIVSPYTGVDMHKIPATILNNNPKYWIKEIENAIKNVINNYATIQTQMPIIRNQIIREHNWINFRKNVVNFVKTIYDQYH